MTLRLLCLSWQDASKIFTQLLKRKEQKRPRPSRRNLTGEVCQLRLYYNKCLCFKFRFCPHFNYSIPLPIFHNYFKINGHLSMFYTILTEESNFRDFLFASLDEIALPKQGLSSKRKNLTFTTMEGKKKKWQNPFTFNNPLYDNLLHPHHQKGVMGIMQHGILSDT